jgi:hypothetical protein
LNPLFLQCVGPDQGNNPYTTGLAFESVDLT